MLTQTPTYIFLLFLFVWGLLLYLDGAETDCHDLEQWFPTQGNCRTTPQTDVGSYIFATIWEPHVGEHCSGRCRQKDISIMASPVSNIFREGDHIETQLYCECTRDRFVAKISHSKSEAKSTTNCVDFGVNLFCRSSVLSPPLCLGKFHNVTYAYMDKFYWSVQRQRRRGILPLLLLGLV